MNVPANVACSVCEKPIKVGDFINATCTGFLPNGKPTVNFTHVACVEREVDQFQEYLEADR